MNQFTYENQGVNTFLVYEMLSTETIDSLSLGMITNNKIENVLPVIFTQIDDKKYLKYNVSSKVSVKQFFEGSVNKKRLLGILSSIASGILAAEEYMIDTSNFLFDLDYIFADVTTSEASLICLPIINKTSQIIDLKAFYKNIVFSTQFDQTENCDYVAKIISYLNSSDAFSLVGFKKTIDSLMVNQMVNNNTGNNQKPMPAPVVNNNMGYQQPQMQRMQPENMQIPVNSSPMTAAQPSPQIGNMQNNPSVNQQLQPSGMPAPVNTVFPEKAAKKEKKSWFGIKRKEKESKKTEKNYVNEKTGRKIRIPGVDEEKIPSERQTGIPPQQQMGLNENASINSEKASAAKMTAATVQPPVQSPMQPPVQQNIYTVPVNSMSNNQSFGETTVLGNSVAGETTVLGASSVVQSRAYIIRNKNNEKIYLDKPVFRIGKEKSFVDYFIGDNAAISRSHVNVIRRGENYYIVDTNSTNHTYVNGTMIQSNIETPLSHGTKFMLADEEFEYREY